MPNNKVDDARLIRVPYGDVEVYTKPYKDPFQVFVYTSGCNLVYDVHNIGMPSRLGRRALINSLKFELLSHAAPLPVEKLGPSLIRIFEAWISGQNLGGNLGGYVNWRHTAERNASHAIQ